ncbi:transcriptional repressor LexA [Piscibacillus halophilus]|uniref:LexA repressor n=1 Tax=Piscibacillus halophilus TaxID=571933 RepID=A0A1H8Z6Y8_9BACI|nr:transcriptional repressor LexA [Piscibacillus halophilus]SEP60194.1 SOS-response transcriptional repressor, LexA [Piscibacillus halophilus]
MKKLSKRQKEIFDFIVNNVNLKGYPPSVREIAEAVGLASSSTVHGHLSRLEEKGYIRRDPTKPRAIEIVYNDENATHEREAMYAPLIGKVTAGEPITAIENVEEYIPIPSTVSATEDEVFVLSIQGDSMIEAGIFDKDLVIVRKQATANNGDIVVAMTEEDEATVKRFFKDENHYRLEPENPTMEPIILNHVTVLGKVIGLYREIH